MLDCVIYAASGAAPVTQAEHGASFPDVAAAQDDMIAHVLCLVAAVLLAYPGSLSNIKPGHAALYVNGHATLHVNGYATLHVNDHATLHVHQAGTMCMTPMHAHHRAFRLTSSFWCTSTTGFPSMFC